MGLDTSLESLVDLRTNLLHSVVQEPEESTDTCYENSISCNAGLICHDDPQVLQQSLSYHFKETRELTAAKFLLKHDVANKILCHKEIFYQQ